MRCPPAGGVLRYLGERKVGFDWGTPDVRIPIVVSAVIDDLAVGNPRIRPDEDGRIQGLRGRFDMQRSRKAMSEPAPAPPLGRCIAGAASAG